MIPVFLTPTRETQKSGGEIGGQRLRVQVYYISNIQTIQINISNRQLNRKAELKV
jgi:hypothetical protein